MTKYYQNWEEAAEASRTGRAVASIIVEHKGMKHNGEIIKAKGKDGIIVFRHSAVKIRDATPSEVDTATYWKSV